MGGGVGGYDGWRERRQAVCKAPPIVARRGTDKRRKRRYGGGDSTTVCATAAPPRGAPFPTRTPPRRSGRERGAAAALASTTTATRSHTPAGPQTQSAAREACKSRCAAHDQSGHCTGSRRCGGVSGASSPSRPSRRGGSSKAYRGHRNAHAVVTIMLAPGMWCKPTGALDVHWK